MQSTSQKVRKSRRNHKFKILVILALIALFFLFRYMVAQPFMYFGSVEVINAVNLTKQDVLLIARIREPINLFLNNNDEIKNNLKEDLRIKDVKVEYAFPQKVKITIQENKPIICLQSKHAFYEVDSKGVILRVTSNVKNPNIPIITGIKISELYVGEQIKVDLVVNIIKFISSLDEDVYNSISEINMNNEIVSILTLNRVKIILGKATDIPDKSETFKLVMQEIQAKKMAIEYIDLTYSRPFIKLKVK